jgi:hypothetical protein
MSSYAPNEYDSPEDDPYHPDYREVGVPRSVAAPTNGMAVASFVCGWLFCFFIPSLLALVFGIVALRQTRSGTTSGRRFAIWGLVLGIFGTGLWIVFIAMVSSFVQMYWADAARAQAVATSFLQDLSDEKIDAALSKVAPDAGPELDRAHLIDASRPMKVWGPFNEISVIAIRPDLAPTPPIEIRRWDFDGEAVFSRASKSLSIRLVKDGANYKVDRFECK